MLCMFKEEEEELEVVIILPPPALLTMPAMMAGDVESASHSLLSSESSLEDVLPLR